MNFNCFIIINLLIYSTLIAQGQSITGSVKDEQGQVLAGVYIYLEGSASHSFTDTKGQFAMLNVSSGTYVLHANFAGFLEKSLTVYLTDNQELELSIQLVSETRQLNEVVVIGVASKNGLGHLPEIVGPIIYSGKKTEVLVLDSIDGNKAQNNTRQILGRIPGMNFSETEGAGFPSNGFGLRGLNPSQSIEMNTRQNGYNITSDIYGYNESYYNPAMEAVDKIEVVRGAASLQFGPQFGGTVNFVMKQAPQDKKIQYTTQQTIGSYGLFNSFHSLAGTLGKWSYYTYGQYKNSLGWRRNSAYSAFTGFAKLEYQATSKLKMGLEYSILRNRIQMPGGLTDIEFQQDSRRSFRERNWLNSPWNIVTGTVEYKASDKTTLSIKSAFLFSERNLVWRNEDGGPGVADSISPLTNSYVAREVQREGFLSSTTEARVLTNYKSLGLNNTFAGGVRYFAGKMQRQGGGPGSTGSDFNLNLYGGDYEYSLKFTTTNVSLFFENIIRITNKWSVTPGFRWEYINSTVDGYITDTDNGDTKVQSKDSRKRYIPLLGIGSQYKISQSSYIYANWSQAYRPMDYSSLTPIGVTSRIDPHMKDAYGYNADLGWRGTISNFLNFDLGFFYLQYNRRIGLISQSDAATGETYTLRTNTGNSVSKGIETYVEINPIKMFNKNSKIGNISLFNSLAYIDAKYVSGTDDHGASISGKHVEYAPNIINRFGITYGFKNFSVTYQLSNTGLSYGDANNTVQSGNALIGIIPAYKVIDISATYKIKNCNIKAGINNFNNSTYFTKRTDEYPGPGIIPAQGRSMYVSLGTRF